MSVAVYERDEAADSRHQGSTIQINGTGSVALHQCLPRDIWTMLEDNSSANSRRTIIVTERLDELDGAGDVELESQIARYRIVERAMLRRLLLAHMQGVVNYGRRFVKFEVNSCGGVTAQFADESSVRCDVLVGADGVNSTVRKQYLPTVGLRNTVVIGGDSHLPREVAYLRDRFMVHGALVVMAPQCKLILSCKDNVGTEVAFGMEAADEYFGLSSYDYDTDHSRERLARVLRSVVRDWHPALRSIIGNANQNLMYVNWYKTVAPSEPWRSSRVTVLGDAIHRVTPIRGVGANLALMDAALLCSRLCAVRDDGSDLVGAISSYEQIMRGYAFGDAVGR